jgi:hypothetical protein
MGILGLVSDVVKAIVILQSVAQVCYPKNS